MGQDREWNPRSLCLPILQQASVTPIGQVPCPPLVLALPPARHGSLCEHHMHVEVWSADLTVPTGLLLIGTLVQMHMMALLGFFQGFFKHGEFYIKL